MFYSFIHALVCSRPVTNYQAPLETVCLSSSFQARVTSRYSPLVIDTQIHASRKLPLNNSRVSTQMWVVVQVHPERPVYTLLNAAGRTYANTSGGMSILFQWARNKFSFLGRFSRGKGAANNAIPLVGFKGTGNRSQRWTIDLSNDKINYV